LDVGISFKEEYQRHRDILSKLKCLDKLAFEWDTAFYRIFNDKNTQLQAQEDIQTFHLQQDSLCGTDLQQQTSNPFGPVDEIKSDDAGSGANTEGADVREEEPPSPKVRSRA
jgi:hypothetical protein